MIAEYLAARLKTKSTKTIRFDALILTKQIREQQPKLSQLNKQSTTRLDGQVLRTATMLAQGWHRQLSRRIRQLIC